MEEYEWEIAERLNKGIEADDIREVASVVDYLADQSFLEDEEKAMLYLAREYASDKGFEGVKEWTESISEEGITVSDFLKNSGIATGAVFASNAMYDFLTEQPVDPLDFYTGIEELTATSLGSVGILTGYFRCRRLRDSPPAFEDIEDNVHRVVAESDIPELEEAFLEYYD